MAEVRSRKSIVGFMAKNKNALLVFLALVAVGPFVCLFGWRNGADCDIWHVLSTGRYLIESGLHFPDTEPLTMHEGLEYVPQQWLYAILLYAVYSLGGNAAYILLLWAVVIICALAIYCFPTENERKSRSLIVIALFVFGMIVWAMPKVRVFDCLLVVLLSACLTRWRKSGQAVWLIAAPVSALVMINAHAALWPLVFLVGFAFLADALLEKNLRGVGQLIFAGTASLIMLLVNPYGIDAITLVFRSMSPDITDAIMECKSPFTLKHGMLGYFSIALIGASLATIVFKRKDRGLRPLLFLLAISMLLAAWSYRNTNILVTAFALTLIEVPLARIEFSKTGAKVLLIVLTLAAGLSIPMYMKTVGALEGPRDPQSECVVLACSELGRDASTVSVYEFDSSYSEFAYRIRGYHDARAELFLEKVNRRSDLSGEYIATSHDMVAASEGDECAQARLREFIEKYQFDFIETEEEVVPFMSALGEAAEQCGYRKIAEMREGSVYTKLEGEFSTNNLANKLDEKE